MIGAQFRVLFSTIAQKTINYPIPYISFIVKHLNFFAIFTIVPEERSMPQMLVQEEEN